MAIGLLIPPTGRSTAQPSSSASAETGQTQQRSRCGAFSAHLKDAVKNTDDEQPPSFSDAGNPIEPASAIVVDDHAAGAELISTVVMSLSQASDTHEAATPMDDEAESLPTANANASVNPSPNPNPNANPTGPTLQNGESTPLLPQGQTLVAAPDDTTLGHEPVTANPPQVQTTDSSSMSLPQPVPDPNQSSEALGTQEDAGAANKLAIRNGRGTPAHLAPDSLEQPSDASALSGTRLPSSLISDQGPSSIMENQGSTNLSPAAYGNGVVPSLARPSTDIRPSSMNQEHGDQETTLQGQSLSVRVIQESGGGAQGSFGDPAQGEGGGSFFQFNAAETPESVMRGNQSPPFSDQFMSARQTSPSPQGVGSPVVMSSADHLKLTQGFLAGDQLATMTSTSGTPQTINVQLPFHDSGPLNVRISMTDQTVHTQFTTDRSDLGALLFMRQDQLQQNLIKSGLELGQFQVHVNQEGRQDTLPDRQPRRNDGAADQQSASQDHKPQTHDRDRPDHRPMRTLSLFA
jgi:hypothetical protein